MELKEICESNVFCDVMRKHYADIQNFTLTGHVKPLGKFLDLSVSIPNL